MVDEYFSDKIKKASDELINVRRDISEQKEKAGNKEVKSITVVKRIEKLVIVCTRAMSFNHYPILLFIADYYGNLIP